MEEDVGRYIKGVFVDTASDMAPSSISIASLSDETVIMPNEKETLDVDLPVDKNVRQFKEDNPGDVSNVDVHIEYSLPTARERIQGTRPYSCYKDLH
jgi:hypothetical protein